MFPIRTSLRCCESSRMKVMRHLAFAMYYSQWQLQRVICSYRLRFFEVQDVPNEAAWNQGSTLFGSYFSNIICTKFIHGYIYIDSTTKVVLFFPSTLYCRGSLLVEKESGRADGRTGLGWAHLVSPFVPLASRHVSLAFLLLWLFSK